MKQILELLKELLDEHVLTIEQDKKVRKILCRYKSKQRAISNEIDKILRSL
jgi:hypothetical protein